MRGRSRSGSIPAASSRPSSRPGGTPNERTEPVLAELAEAGTDFIGMERDSRFDLRPWRRLVGEMRDRQIDILHTHKIGSNLWGALLTPRVPVPIFVAHEHTWSWEGQPHRRLHRPPPDRAAAPPPSSPSREPTSGE